MSYPNNCQDHGRRTVWTGLWSRINPIHTQKLLMVAKLRKRKPIPIWEIVQTTFFPRRNLKQIEFPLEGEIAASFFLRDQKVLLLLTICMHTLARRTLCDVHWLIWYWVTVMMLATASLTLWQPIVIWHIPLMFTPNSENKLNQL